MKKKNLIAVLSICVLGSTSFAQNVLPASGSVGIGTTTPEEKLVVKGNVKVDSCVIIKDSIIVDKNARIKGDEKVEGSLYVGNNIFGDKNLEISKNATIAKDVTIGRNLSVDNKIMAPNLPDANNTNNKKFLVLTPNGSIKSVTLSQVLETVYQPFACPEGPNGPIILPPTWQNGPGVLYTGTQPCTGYAQVGIGTNVPNARLGIHLNSNLIDNAFLVKRIDVNTGEYNDMFKLTSKGEFNLTINSTDNNVVPLLVKNELGNKLMQLDNEGFLRVRRVRVDTEVWPDYVFERSYQLLSLEATEKFIKENGHLPNVPSAETVEAEGQDLGEMNKILMEKVEELTLHLIEQNKRIKELEEKVAANQETKK